MSTNFQIEYTENNGDLYVSPKGDFDGGSAWELINLLDKNYKGKGRVIIDTQYLREICPFGCSTFQCRLSQIKLPSSRLSFKGEKGYSIAPRGSRVFVSAEKRECRCEGNCANCPCSKEKK